MSVKVETTIHLRECPFCGAEAHLSKGEIWGVELYKVECPHCHASSTKVRVGIHLMYNGENNVNFTKEKAIEQAVSYWNNRTEKTA